MEQLVDRLIVILRTIATMGYITAGVFILGIEYKFYRDHFRSTRRNNIFFYFAVGLTVLVLIFIYVVVFRGFRRTDI